MTRKQKAALSAFVGNVERVAGELASAKERALKEAMAIAPNPLGTASYEAARLGAECEGRSRELAALIDFARSAFPGAALAPKREAA